MCHRLQFALSDVLLIGDGTFTHNLQPRLQHSTAGVP